MRAYGGTLCERAARGAGRVCTHQVAAREVVAQEERRKHVGQLPRHHLRHIMQAAPAVRGIQWHSVAPSLASALAANARGPAMCEDWRNIGREKLRTQRSIWSYRHHSPRKDLRFPSIQPPEKWCQYIQTRRVAPERESVIVLRGGSRSLHHPNTPVGQFPSV
jgi:hypothetical protein